MLKLWKEEREKRLHCQYWHSPTLPATLSPAHFNTLTPAPTITPTRISFATPTFFFSSILFIDLRHILYFKYMPYYHSVHFCKYCKSDKSWKTLGINFQWVRQPNGERGNQTISKQKKIEHQVINSRMQDCFLNQNFALCSLMKDFYF